MNRQRTLLLIPEIDDNMEGIINLELSTLGRFTIKEAQRAYKILVRSSKPTFSGSIDHRINLLDARKVLPIMNMNEDKVANIIQQAAGDGVNLMKELKYNFDDLMSRTIYHGYWETINENKGCLPDARKGATMNMIGSNIYVFGGLSRETYNDIKIFEIDHRRWKGVSYEGMKAPEARIHHSIV